MQFLFIITQPNTHLTLFMATWHGFHLLKRVGILLSYESFFLFFFFFLGNKEIMIWLTSSQCPQQFRSIKWLNWIMKLQCKSTSHNLLNLIEQFNLVGLHIQIGCCALHAVVPICLIRFCFNNRAKLTINYMCSRSYNSCGMWLERYPCFQKILFLISLYSSTSWIKKVYVE